MKDFQFICICILLTLIIFNTSQIRNSLKKIEVTYQEQYIKEN